jgi:hypothetical protein
MRMMPCFLQYCLLLSASLSAAAAPPSDNADVDLHLTDGRTAIDVSINAGPSLRVNYDSGAQGMVIAKSLADELKLPVVGEMLLGSPAGGTPVPVKVVQLQSLAVGGVKVDTAPRSLDGLMMDDAQMPPGVRLILASSNFPNRIVELDFPANRFRLTPSVASNAKGWQPLDERGLPATTITIGKHSIPLYVDTGNPGVLDFPETIAAQLPLSSALVPHRKIKLVDKTLDSFSAMLTTDAKIGGTKVKLSGSFVFAPLPFANLGAGALSKARLQIDHTGKRWRLRFTDTPGIIRGQLLEQKQPAP